MGAPPAAQVTPTGGQTMTDSDELNSLLHRLRATTRCRVLAVLTGPQPAHALLAQLRRALATRRERRIEVWLLCSPAWLAQQSVRDQLHDLVASGVQVRTSDTPPQSLMVFDQSTALIAVDGRRPASGVRIVEDPIVVRGLEALARALWETGRSPDDDEPPPSAVEHRVLRMLGLGVTDETAARRLNMSERTFRRHVARLMARLGTSSRFQAGAEAARRGWI
ncbi:helix-turn-helix transcriptional regulator [Streptoalloteichus hindustanus]|uniref:Regulatory protein, luxR family n=1 Tax=Streptoalloteichus hindustanus TaxID=2017 RepID=A0A1M5AIV9_STRHI|nr:LuxR C-terminal-related transcriptional regulator [Streptoalloteichus hindustanus]SHF30211.1 regulatory protein, luxR family [Streptoalloteichus hindustanus]